MIAGERAPCREPQEGLSPDSDGVVPVPVPNQGKPIGFLFHMGHGHYTQFMNFRECIPSGYARRAEWIPLRGEEPANWLGRCRAVPPGLRFRLNQTAHAARGLRRHSDWQAVFIAAEMASLTPLMRRHRSYLYTDLTPSLKRELSPWYDHQLRGKGLLAAIRRRIRRRMYQACVGVFTMSRWAAGGVMRDYRIAPDHVHVVLPGANLNRWHFVDRATRPATEPVRILMVGGEFRLKGGPEMLDWAESTSVKGWELDIVTWPGYLPVWARECLGEPGPTDCVSGTLAPRLPNVRIHCGIRPNTPEVIGLFERADIHCLPTHADGSSIASLEAMATGLPVLVGAVGGIPELIEDGVTGFLLRRGRADDLAERLEALIQDRDLRLRVGAAARQSCEDVYNVPRQLGQILAVMDGPKGSRR